MYIFWTEHLISDNQFFLWKTLSFTCSIPYIPVVLCVVLRPLVLSSAAVKMSLAAIPLQFMLRQSYW